MATPSDDRLTLSQLTESASKCRVNIMPACVGASDKFSRLAGISIPAAPFTDKFFAKVEVFGECWTWVGSAANGYGRFGIGYKGHLAHRVSYILFNGEIPCGLVLDHTCRNRLCVNPSHLKAVTVRENNSLALPFRKSMKGICCDPRKVRGPRQRCPNGHIKDQSNVVIVGKKNPKNFCKVCYQRRNKRPRGSTQPSHQ